MFFAETVENGRVRKTFFFSRVNTESCLIKISLHNRQLLLHRSEITKQNICYLYVSFGYYN